MIGHHTDNTRLRENDDLLLKRAPLWENWIVTGMYERPYEQSPNAVGYSHTSDIVIATIVSRNINGFIVGRQKDQELNDILESQQDYLFFSESNPLQILWKYA